MRKIKHLLTKYALKPNRYELKGNITLIDTESGKYVIKNKVKEKDNIYKYLNSRSFNYYPRPLSDINDDYEITEFLEEIEMPREQKMMDMIDLVALLHSKTTHYKEVDEDDYKKIYEDVRNNIAYLNSYYNDIISIIETKVFMSPSEYLFARNVSEIFSALNYSQHEIEDWYKLVKEKRKQRLVVLHNNLDINHFIRNENAYLISWDKSKVDIPIFDLYKLYNRHFLEYDFEDILKRYETTYPLLTEERKLFFILIALPKKIEFSGSEYEMCSVISKEIDRLFKTEKLISPYYSKNAPKNT